MSFRSIVRDVRDGFGSLSRRGFEVRILGHRRGKSHGAVHELHDPVPVIQSSCWASLPPELLRDIIERLEESEATWPSRKHVVACAGVCRTWREMCKEIVKNPELCGKITFPISLSLGHEMELCSVSLGGISLRRPTICTSLLALLCLLTMANSFYQQKETGMQHVQNM
ncbi:Os11g0163600 [Oryza sativa Japonica Group]|uniref:Os11g0163600 protein n=1 Tax=Oryza sativa subsp. japonica TaxID=39947 RepID=A0A0P0XZ63_ORYSJ|nr:hypothetical protein EE612_053684 [Oryza sativa]BAT12817.1 Os11g0163600 [Oryza sativa Japonica Group]